MDKIKIIKFEDKNYPDSLRTIFNAPKILYYMGTMKKEELCFSVVGSRKCSLYGKEVVVDIVGKLVDAGLTIVSGFAPGIDTLAHQICIEKKKRTIAVLGTGLDRRNIYPKENLDMIDKIIECGGCVMSELAPEIPGSVFTFPKRNRIISGLSKGVLVVEARIKSGSLITANYAMEQQKKLFSVPGPIYSGNSKGTNFIIKKGAKLVDNVNDILQELDLSVVKTQNYESSNS